MIRRSLTLFVIMYLMDYPIFQMQVIIAMSFLNVTYMLDQKPLLGQKSYYYNEAFTLVVVDLIYALLNISLDSKSRLNLGSLVISSITLIIVYNLGISFWNLSMDCRKSFKLSLRSFKKERFERNNIDSMKHLLAHLEIKQFE